jgi:iron(III) transport system substrate-binding protein
MRPAATLLALLVALPAVGGCADESADTPEPQEPLVIYSGRSEVLVEPLLDQFRDATGIAVEARYGSDAELLAQLREEGTATPADVYWANTTGALVEADAAGMLSDLPDSLRALPDAFVPPDGRWVPATVRFRTLAYSPARVDSTALPSSVFGLPGMTALRGRVGWTPTYSSFQDFVSAMRVLHGDDSTRAWIDGMKRLEPRAYASNTPMLEALVAGEIDVAITNHYYVFRILQGESEAAGAGEGAAAPGIAIHTFAPGDVGNLALVTGAGVLGTSGRRDAALRFLAFLLSDAAQTTAAESVHEYPVVSGATLPPYLIPFDRAVSLGPTVDPARMTDLEGTLAMLRDADLL